MRRTRASREVIPAEEIETERRTRGDPAKVRLDRDEVEVQLSARIPLVPDDPKSAVIRGKRARVVWAPDRLHDLRVISAAEYQAARRYRDDWERANLPRTATRSPVWVPTSHRGSLPISDAQHRAARAASRAEMALGEGLAQVAALVILGNASIRTLAESRAWPVSYASGFFKAVIVRLDSHYRAEK